MGKIIELCEKISNQIAAGEVVERPASVVKELIENAVDAQAKTVDIRIKDGGFSYLIVQDDGEGMDDQDVMLSIRRYATSKLAAVSDLDRIDTFGFRGEALPSIASVSRLTIFSRKKDAPFGTKLIAHGGQICEQVKAGALLGTRVEVRDIFYNVPARLKFAKSKRVEVAEIHRLIRAFAFVYQNIAWKFFVDDKLIFSCAHEEKNLDRAASLLGDEHKDLLFVLDIKQNPNLILEGVVGAPMAQRRDTRGIIFFVNNRLVTDKKLSMAVKTAFQSLIEIGHYPICALKIFLAPDEVDVNIHPRKTEVRFRDEKAVVANVINELKNFLAKTPWLFDAKKDMASALPSLPNRSENYHRHAFAIGSTPFSHKEFSFGDKIEVLPEVIEDVSHRLLSSNSFASLRAIGQVSSTYLLAQSETGLVIIDQHAAHERVMYEKIRAKKDQSMSTMPLLIPITLNLGTSSMNLFEEFKNEIAAIGIEAEIFGENNIVIRSLPDFIHNIDIKNFIEAILADLLNYGHSATVSDLFHHLCATLACHSSIRAGQHLTLTEIEALLDKLDDIEFGAHCPHGRPIVKSISAFEMKKWFDRT
jgi:DNA mismatch repair protein MutL